MVENGNLTVFTMVENGHLTVFTRTEWDVSLRNFRFSERNSGIVIKKSGNIAKTVDFNRKFED